MTTETQKLTAQIAEAEAALHALMTGRAQVKVGYDGTSAEFNRASAPELRRYIATLKRKLPRKDPGEIPGPGSRRVTF